MLLKFFVTYTIALLLHTNWQIYGQCPLPAQMLNQLELINKGDAPNSKKIAELQELRKIYLKCNKTTDSIYARILHRLGDLYSKEDELDKAIKYTKEAVSINSSKNNKAERSFLANSFLNLSNFYDQLNQREDCAACRDTCIAISTQYPDKYFIAFRAFAAKAFAFFQTGDYQGSVETSDHGLLFAKQIKDTLSTVPLLSQKAQALIQLDNISEAEQDIQKAILILKTSNAGKDQLATAYSIYATLLIKKNDTKGAIYYYKKAYKLNESIENWEQCSRDLSDLGYVYDSQLHDAVKAMACYNDGMKIVDKANNAYLRSAFYINMGLAQWRQKNYSNSLQYYQKALNIMPINFTDTSLQNNPTEAMLRLSANDYFISTLLANKGDALLDLYRNNKVTDALYAALNTYKMADKAVDIMRWRQYGEQSKLFWRQKTRKMYENAIEACFLANDIQKAYYFFEKSRAVLLSDRLNELGAKQFIAPDDRIKAQKLRVNVLSLSRQLSLYAESSAEYNNIRQLLLNAQEEWEQYIKSLEEKYPVYYQYKYSNIIYPYSDIKKVLKENKQSLVEFFNADSIIYVLLISREKDTMLKIPFKDYKYVTEQFMTLCSNESLLNQNYNRYIILANQLYNKLFKPLHVPEGRVMISPDDHFIPFEALITEPFAPDSFLLRKYAFSYIYSVGLLLKSSQNNYSGKSSFLGIAPGTFKPYMKQAALAGGDASLNKIAPYFITAKFLLNGDATKQQFLSNIASYTIVQIYSHADADSVYKQPVLYLRDSSVTITEIQTLEDCLAQMVVLSGCKTGIGINAKGEGIFSLARGFMAAGVPCTVTTLWQIDSKATYELTEIFYKYLSKGLPKDQALQQAKLEFLATNDKIKQLPYFWASSILLGNADKLQISEGASYIYFYIGAGLLLICGALVIIKYKRKLLKVSKNQAA